MKKLNFKNYDWVEKIAVATGLVALIMVGTHQSLADNLYNEYAQPVQNTPKKTTTAPKKKIAKRAKKKVLKQAAHKAILTPEAKHERVLAKKRAVHNSIDNEIQNMSDDLEKPDSQQAVQRQRQQQAPPVLIAQNDNQQNDVTKSTPPQRQGLNYMKVVGPQDTYAMALPTAANTSMTVIPHDQTTTTTTKSDVTDATAPESPYSGGVNFTFGHDNNIDPDKTGMTSSFYAIEPSLNYKVGNWTASFTGTMKDYTEQDVSDTNKSTEAKADLSYEAALSDIAKSTTTVEGVYHNEMMPNDIQGPGLDGTDPGIAILYYDAKLTEKVAFNFGNGFSTEIGGFYLHRENTSYMSDYAADILDPLFTTGSFNEYNAFAKIAMQAGDYVEFALRPVIDDKAYTEREARQSDGSTGGTLLSAPLRDLLKTELNFDITLKYNGSTFGPTASIGQVSDEATGGENNSYYGGGLKGNIILVPDWKLTVSPSLMYKHVNYDNWTDGVSTPGALRVDDDVEMAVNAKVMFTKNFGWGAGYANSHYTSSWAYTGVNYNEEVISTTAMFSF
jgi:hypothetical protein